MAQIFTVSQRYHKYYQRLEPIFKQKQNQAYTMVILSLFTIAFFGVFAIRPTLKTIGTLHRQIEDKTELNEKLETKITALIAAQDTYQQMQNNLDKIYSLMPAEVEFPSLIRRLELVGVANSALISNVSVDEIFLYNKAKVAAPSTPQTPTGDDLDDSLGTANPTPAPKTTASTPKTTPAAPVSVEIKFTVTFAGDYQNLTDMLNHLTQIDRLITMDTIDINRGRSGEAATLSLTLNAMAYYMPL